MSHAAPTGPAQTTGASLPHDSAELIHDRLMDRLRFDRRAGRVALHVTCSTTKMGLDPKLRAVAAGTKPPEVRRGEPESDLPQSAQPPGIV